MQDIEMMGKGGFRILNRLGETPLESTSDVGRERDLTMNGLIHPSQLKAFAGPVERLIPWISRRFVDI